MLCLKKKNKWKYARSFLFVSNVQLVPHPTQNQPSNPVPKPLSAWTNKDVQEWFLSSKYKNYAPKFLGLDGEELAGMKEEQFKSRCPDKGDVIYNKMQELKQGKSC